MDRDELLLVGVLLVVILVGLGVKQLGRGPQIEPVVIEAEQGHPLVSATPGGVFPGIPAVGLMAPSAYERSGQTGSGRLPDINQATALELQCVSGIGPVLAQDILNYRSAHGPFRTMDDLLQVSGIGPSRLQAIQEAFSVHHAAAPQEQPPDPPLAIPRQPEAQQPPARLDLNRASPSDLETLPGIGPVLARQIIDFRRQHGPFTRTEQIMEVSGIGPGRYEQIAERIYVGADREPAASGAQMENRPETSASGSTTPDEPAKVGIETPGKIDLNRATQTQLESLPGIGPVLAERIIQYRQRSGGFQSPEELKNVSGIGEKKYAAIRPLIEISW